MRDDESGEGGEFEREHGMDGVASGYEGRQAGRQGAAPSLLRMKALRIGQF